MSSTYQLICTIISFILNSFLVWLILTRSPQQTGKYKWLMLYTTCFEIFWGAFDLPAEIIAHSVGCAFIVFRVNDVDSLLSSDTSSWVVLVYTAIFGASMALFASHFIYRYGSIDSNFGEKYTSGWKFGVLFFIPVITGIWWATVVRVWFWPNQDMDDYTRELIMEKVGVGIQNISYIGAKFYNKDGLNGTNSLNQPAWIGVSQMWFMVISSMICVFGFGTLCYLRLSNQLSIVSSAANNLQVQFFYTLVLQTAIPLILMHIPITIYFLCPMLDLDFDFASSFVASTIALYPAVDPLPSFLIIKSYRQATIGFLRSLLFLPGNKYQTRPTITVNSIGPRSFSQTVN
ncbi:hypothetical protein GCK72_012039 [Caenorhabditis remanei]|uniref:Seven TM Receptor n=1 Tax=Caenorhabditis remanei TaxID=31234 RepID=A0A6A5GMN3_CAERE|nr:hypothetical protein GCK72_012039 [Caenorhabditis remanei]KAF1755589.1 hypothetical protein GCK72_012039 [Caenorhabditis remanei]